MRDESLLSSDSTIGKESNENEQQNNRLSR
jgi:hypothetical protein